MSIERDQTAAVLDALVSLVRTSRTVAHRDGEHSVSATPITLLRLVRSSEPRLGDLAEQLRVKPSVASRTVDALEIAGYVARVTDPDDARACRVRITDLGRDHLAEREDYALHEFAHTFDDWSPEDAALAVRVLNRIETGVLDWVAALEQHQQVGDDHRHAGCTAPTTDPDSRPASEQPHPTNTDREMTAA